MSICDVHPHLTLFSRPVALKVTRGAEAMMLEAIVVRI